MLTDGVDRNIGIRLPSNYLKQGRWTFAEERQLIDGMSAGETVEAVAVRLRRSLSSAQRKVTELRLDKPTEALTDFQNKAVVEAARDRALSARCKELALLAGEKELTDRLNAMAVEFHERAWAVEARAGLPLTRDPGKVAQPF
jgi:hypothetical protein